GQPLANALVTVRSYGVNAPGGTATTDREGNFQVGGLDPFAYMVSAALPGYVGTPRDPDANPIGFYRVGESARIELVKGGVISGSVKRANGDPVVNVLVRAYMIRDAKGQPRYGSLARLRQTDDRGVYRIYGLAPGAYIISAGGLGNTNGYSVDPYGGDVPTYAPSSPRDAATEVSVTSGEEVANVDIRYREEPGHTVSGSASSTVANEQQSGFNISLVSILNGAAQASYTFFQQPQARGFAISGVADGEYDVIAQQYNGAGGWVISESRRIQVRGADVTGLELILKPLASIAGSLLLEESKLPECAGKRRPLVSETVIGPWHNEKTVRKDQPQFVWSLGTPVLPDKDGKFVLGSLAPGQYRFNARPLAKYWYLKSMSWPTGATSASAKGDAPDRPRDAARNWTNVRMGERLTGLTITFAEGAASLRGKVEAGEGKKLPSRLFVYLAPAEPARAEDIVRYFSSLAAEDGGFALTNLPPGRYWLTLAPAADGDSNMMSKLRLPDETELRAKLRREGEASKLQIELKPCQNISDYQLAFK
ncbi:MAG TPA: carboxypeptidase-like regulatory domain-containing protein, partial [Pyrinomonadaceae bacterium]|nr:carboxypeptidase-like regulatory domain-containing protein [Pyrinomonadaceae bacterium]